ncbi:glycoside hydrolase family 32 protein [Actinomyces sp.]|uniref:glycoside hydrolase family 32 protein n=1 Tax=Actinomyces sp. TaxID=29317 RepID=UPI0026DDB637|nr:glycoside hydrolase family 32 protein [Actinomyces sp.]MDO4899224.1 glycoside hydrolase family 32 protein [Actinomyces sp.]
MNSVVPPESSPEPASADGGLFQDELLTRAQADPLLPRFHFTPPAGWMNDPNGLLHRDGIHHLFYQYNPVGPTHHRIHWGHAVSRDLLTWTDLPIALAPAQAGRGADADGCWSGVAVVDRGLPTLVYSANREGRQAAALAVAADGADPFLVGWDKYPHNPVIAGPPDTPEITGFRDHCVWQEADGSWTGLMGAGTVEHGGTVLRYTSPDLRHWTYRGPILSGSDWQSGPEEPWTATMWECPDLIALQEPIHDDPGGAVTGSATHALIFSAWNQGQPLEALAFIGHYSGGRFHPTGLRRVDWGGRFCYAPQSYLDETGRRIQFGWMPEGREERSVARAGWCGAMTVPRLLSADADGGLAVEPVPELARLREQHEVIPEGVLDGGRWASSTRGGGLDIELVLALDQEGCAEVVLDHDGEESDRGERTVIRMARGADGCVIEVDTSQSSHEPGVDAGLKTMPVRTRGDENDPVHLRVILDRSTLELFSDHRALSARIYPAYPESTRLVVTGERTRICAGSVWTMRSTRQANRRRRP